MACQANYSIELQRGRGANVLSGSYQFQFRISLHLQTDKKPAS